MKFQLRGHGWSIDGGRMYLPEGTIVDTSDPGSAALMPRNGAIPPINSQPLEQSAYDSMRTRYEAWQIFTHPIHGINRR